MNSNSKTADQHLNLFRFFNESDGTVFIENNLSRAFALCLKNSNQLFNEYLREILSKDDYKYLFSASASDTDYTIDLQVNTSNIEIEGIRVVYAVAMTGNKALEMSDFFDQAELKNKENNITDVFIFIKDIAIIIEVKCTWEDCKQQLFNQVLPFKKKDEPAIIKPIKFAWPDVIELMEKVVNTQAYHKEKNIFIADFLQLSGAKYPDWFNPKPFAVLDFNTHGGTVGHSQLMNRMRQALNMISPRYKLLEYNDRLGLALPFGWASELIPGFESDNGRNYISFYIWPGNTKLQGYGIYNNPLGWMKKKEMNVDDKEYELDIAYNVKFCHFNRYISQLNFYQFDILKELHTKDNFHNVSGKWEYEDWEEFEGIMDSYFKPEFDWRKQCQWEEKFKETDRSYFTMSLGFEVALYVPYKDFQTIDKREEDIQFVSAKIQAVADAFRKLIDG